MSLFPGLLNQQNEDSSGPENYLFSERNIYRRKRGGRGAAVLNDGAIGVANEVKRDSEAKSSTKTSDKLKKRKSKGKQRSENEPEDQVEETKTSKGKVETRKRDRNSHAEKVTSVSKKKPKTKIGAIKNEDGVTSSDEEAFPGLDEQDDGVEDQDIGSPDRYNDVVLRAMDMEQSSDEDEEENRRNKAPNRGTKETAKIQKEKEAEKISRTIFVGNLPPWVKRKSVAKLFEPFGKLESVRIRSLPLQADSKLPRRAAVAIGAIDDVSKGSSHAYVVFCEEKSAVKSLQANMKPVEFSRSAADVGSDDDEVVAPAAGNEIRHIVVNRAGSNMFHVKKLQKLSGRAAANEAAAVGPKVLYDPSKSVFIGNLSLEAQDEDLIRFFNLALGGLSGVFPNKNKTSEKTGVSVSQDLSEVQAVRIVRDAKTAIGKGIAFVMFQSRTSRRAALALDGRNLLGRPLRVRPVKQGGNSVEFFGKHSSAKDAHHQTNKRKHADDQVSTHKSAPWQGLKSTKTGRTRGGDHLKPKHSAKNNVKKFGSLKRVGSLTSKKRVGKRPAVAARKAKQLQTKTK